MSIGDPITATREDVGEFRIKNDIVAFISVFQDILFPKMSKCNMHIYGPSGTLQNFDAMCVLPLNILHDKGPIA